MKDKCAFVLWQRPGASSSARRQDKRQRTCLHKKPWISRGSGSRGARTAFAQKRGTSKRKSNKSCGRNVNWNAGRKSEGGGKNFEPESETHAESGTQIRMRIPDSGPSSTKVGKGSTRHALWFAGQDPGGPDEPVCGATAWQRNGEPFKQMEQVHSSLSSKYVFKCRSLNRNGKSRTRTPNRSRREGALRIPLSPFEMPRALLKISSLRRSLWGHCYKFLWLKNVKNAPCKLFLRHFSSRRAPESPTTATFIVHDKFLL